MCVLPAEVIEDSKTGSRLCRQYVISSAALMLLCVDTCTKSRDRDSVPSEAVGLYMSAFPMDVTRGQRTLSSRTKGDDSRAVEDCAFSTDDFTAARTDGS
jgi:hypothetical protein